MRQEIVLAYEFVDQFPATLQERTIYISMPFATATHKCVCGCGNHVITPLSPTDWQLYFDGLAISLTPSIGNWSFSCRSHYWIRHNKIVWARSWSPQEIDAGRAHDRRAKKEQFDTTKLGKQKQPKKGRWQDFKQRFF